MKTALGNLLKEDVVEKARTVLPLARPYLPHAAGLLVVALLGWANGYFQAAKGVGNPNLKDNWTLPSWSPARTGPEKEKLATLDIWEGQKPKAPKAAVRDTKAWRLVGTLRTGKTYAAVVQVDGGRTQRMTLGDVLPNGEKVIGISHGTLQIEDNGDQQEIKLFHPGRKSDQPDDKLEKK